MTKKILITAVVFNADDETASYTCMCEPDEGIDEFVNEAKAEAIVLFDQDFYNAVGCVVYRDEIELPELPTAHVERESQFEPISFDVKPTE